MLKIPEVNTPREFNLHGLRGISDQTMAMHLTLYQGYVTATNELIEHLWAFLKDGTVDHEGMPAYSELTRRLGFERNGMVLHEQYFGNLMQGGSDRPGRHSLFAKAAENSYGSVDLWKTDFCRVGMLRGVGWAVCSLNPATRRLSNHWISLHEHGHVAGFIPILVMDVWEHAYLLDYKPSERGVYIESFFSNIHWKTVDERLDTAVPAYAGSVPR
ncbi:superoxide dismutase [Nitrospira sp. NS4]|uniref:superoxide dismutase n=1 Tax=Nitrospira sp. NS4 TaxID=3414498 RepID=UPI003C2C31D1